MFIKKKPGQNETDDSFFFSFYDSQENCYAKAHGLKGIEKYFIILIPYGQNIIKIRFSSFLEMKEYILFHWNETQEEKEERLGISIEDFLK